MIKAVEQSSSAGIASSAEGKGLLCQRVCRLNVGLMRCIGMRRTATLFAVLAAALLISAPAALAVTEYFMPQQGQSWQPLAHGHAFGSTSAHTNTGSTYVDTDHTVCAGIEQGFAGDTGTPNSYTLHYGTCQYPTAVYTNLCCTTSYYHGMALNPNGATDDRITNAEYTY